jgi:hypothetical protein
MLLDTINYDIPSRAMAIVDMTDLPTLSLASNRVPITLETINLLIQLNRHSGLHDSCTWIIQPYAAPP